MKEDPREGRRWMEKWTYYLAVPMAALSAIGQINIFNSLAQATVGQESFNFGFTPELWLPSSTVLLAMTAGTMFAIWLGELISEYGIRGQGLSLVIFAGIVARMPANLASACLLMKRHACSCLSVTIVIIMLTVFAIVYVQQGRRNVPVMYPGRRMGSRMSMPVKGTLPLMVNLSGMIPLIFASAILQFPAIIASYFTRTANEGVAQFLYRSAEFLWRHRYQQLGLLANCTSSWLSFLPFSIHLCCSNSRIMARTLKKVGATVPGVHTGAPTQKYLSTVQSRITCRARCSLALLRSCHFFLV